MSNEDSVVRVTRPGAERPGPWSPVSLIAHCSLLIALALVASGVWSFVAFARRAAGGGHRLRVDAVRQPLRRAAHRRGRRDDLGADGAAGGAEPGALLPAVPGDGRAHPGARRRAVVGPGRPGRTDGGGGARLR